jgi:nucleotide-binding universal stress UspA family protein
MSVRPRRILVGYDGSKAAERVLDAAAGLMAYGSTMAVLSVEDGKGGGSRALGPARERLVAKQVTALYLESAGDPADELAAAADRLVADLVVVGRRPQGALRRLVLGSVSERVLGLVPCDVLVVH